MTLFNSNLEAAAPFATTSPGPASAPDIALSASRDAGLYKKSDTVITAVLSNADILDIKKGELTLRDGNAITGTNISLFISGGALFYQGSAGTKTLLGIA